MSLNIQSHIRSRVWLWCLNVFLGVIWTTQAYADAPDRAPKTTPDPTPDGAASALWSADDVLRTESVLDIQVSSDGRHAVWIRRQGIVRKLQELRVADLRARTERVLVDRPVSRPRISPDQRWVSFQEQGQVWRVPLDAASTPQQVTEDLVGLRGHAWRNGGEILFWASTELAETSSAPTPDPDRTIVVSDTHAQPPIHLFSLDLASGDVKQLTEGNTWVFDVQISPDGGRAAIVHWTNPDFEFAQQGPPRVELLDLETGARRDLALLSNYPPAARGPHTVAWSAEGNGLFFSFDHKSPEADSPFVIANEGRIAFLELASRPDAPDRVIPIDFRKGGPWAKSGLQWTHDFLVVPGGVLLRLNDGVLTRAVRVRREGNEFVTVPLAGGDAGHLRHIWFWGASPNGRSLVYQHSTAEKPPQVFVAPLDGTRLGTPHQLGELNPTFAHKPKPRVEVVNWVGGDDEMIEGMMVHPLAAVEGPEAPPLIVSIHGGPLMRDADRWDLRWTVPMVLFSQAGARVFRPNYHGSDGYGLDFAESIRGGRYYELPIQDIVRGVDHLVSAGLADPEKVALHGWSNGAFLSIALMTDTDRFDTHRWRAAAVGAGGIDLTSDWGWIGSGLAFFHSYFGGHPWELDAEQLSALNPFRRVDRVRTPTLVMTGDQDRAVGPSHSWTFYRALQHQGVPVRFLVFPGEPHMLFVEAHQRRKVEEELQWFDRYLPGFRSLTAVGNTAFNPPLNETPKLPSITTPRSAGSQKEKGSLKSASTIQTWVKSVSGNDSRSKS